MLKADSYPNYNTKLISQFDTSQMKSIYLIVNSTLMTIDIFKQDLCFLILTLFTTVWLMIF